MKIEFGHSNDKNPSGSWGGIHISPELPLLSAEYYGAIGLEGKSYIVAKVVEDEYKRYPELLNNFIVREALVDLYRDGSGVLFLDQQKSSVCERIERFLNSPKIKERIINHESLINTCKEIGAHSPSASFYSIEPKYDTALVSTSITHEAFTEKKELLNNCRESITSMQRKIEELYKKLEEQKGHTR